MTETRTITAWKISAEEVHLMRELIAYRKRIGAELVPWRGCWRNGATGQAVTWDDERNGGEVGYTPSDPASYRWTACETFTQAVDVLVALRYLPARFSSAYGAGWRASQVWHDPDECHVPTPEFKRLFHDPANISFPVGLE